ncbi:hypothetical protein CRE_30957 [Caenorhabditis remanei]|uniref:Uncharacterized protein n=1 Tax=Caenorhabditis remanei TaxID=31234 RepID=E3LTS6_CAERE|nr:hypothetical protein CRE_30957 [Caenorhabditis remanei]
MPIPAVSTVRDLGIHFSSQLSFTHHHAETIRKAHQRINIFFSVLKYSSWKICIHQMLCCLLLSTIGIRHCSHISYSKGER